MAIERVAARRGAITWHIAAAVWALCLVLPATVAAQGNVMAIYEPSVNDDLRVDISDMIEEQFTLVDVDDYVQAASEQNLYPLSEAAFQRVLPRGGVSIAVVVMPSAGEITMEVRSGQTGAVLSRHPLQLSGGALTPGARQTIARAIDAGMGQGSDDGMADETVGEDSGGGSDDDDGEQRVFALNVDVGTGLAFRQSEFPLDGGLGNLAVGPSAALDLGLQMVVNPEDTLSIGFQMRYQTTIGATVEEPHVAALPRETGIRASRYTALLVPTLGVGDILRLQLGVGYGVRGLRLDIHHLQTPGYTLAGPVVRLAAVLEFGETVTLSIAPEGQLLVSVGDELQELGASDGGMSIGVEASLAIRASGMLSVLLAFREAHASLAGTAGKPDTSDSERYITGGLRGTL